MKKINASTNKVYTPDGVCRGSTQGIPSVFSLMLIEIVESRELTWRLFLRDFQVKYRQSVLGIMWVFLVPLMTVGMFVIMTRSGVFSIRDVGVPYPLYAVIGLSIWSIFTVGLTACTNSLINAGSMIVKINFPKVSLILAASGQGVVEFLIRFVLIILMFLYYGYFPYWLGILCSIIMLLPIYLLTIGVGFVLSLAAGVFRDVVNVLGVLLAGIMLLTPVLYPLSPNTMLSEVNRWNPLNYLVNAPRDLLVKGHTDIIFPFAISSIFSIVVFYFGWRIFYLAQPKIAERI
jgi:lipopolysaccharide transport system permease protein